MKKECRICRGKTEEFLDLGQTPVPEEFRTKKDLNKPVQYYPLNLVYCLSCKHIQLGFTVSSDTIYKKNYHYDYSVTTTGSKHWHNLANGLIKRFNLSKNDLVLDIGSNTGMLLSIFKKRSIKILGVDPSIKPVRLAKEIGIPTINDFFTYKVAEKTRSNFGHAKLITCTNTFDHVDDLTDFMKGITTLLSKDGVFVIEVPYFPTMLKHLTHIVYHQQIDYITLRPFVDFLERFNMDIFDCELIPMHGGSIRMFIGFKNCYKKSLRCKKIYLQEPVISKKLLSAFSKNVHKQKTELVSLLTELKSHGKKIAGIGAAAKGITLLNYCGLDSKTIDFITEKSSLKINRFTPTKIPITAEATLFKEKPDYALILAWNFQDEIIKNLSDFRNIGKFIIPIPKIKII